MTHQVSSTFVWKFQSSQIVFFSNDKSKLKIPPHTYYGMLKMQADTISVYNNETGFHNAGHALMQSELTSFEPACNDPEREG